ncbi:Uncharacterized protein Adt_33193 [Abeliophyllum distichum]|uniref:Uncharacterized protein n=1 Tax=Abeliophyllum distichum TaxID=126358 RepID=A0ABD1QVJ9_9LAMI
MMKFKPDEEIMQLTVTHRIGAIDNLDMVWILVCYPVEFEKNIEDTWSWKYVGEGKGKTTPINVSRSICFVELYNKVKEVLNVDSSLYEMEMACLVPEMSKAPAAPTVIDCDNNVKWFISICKETYLCVNLSKKNAEESG